MSRRLIEQLAGHMLVTCWSHRKNRIRKVPNALEKMVELVGSNPTLSANNLLKSLIATPRNPGHTVVTSATDRVTSRHGAIGENQPSMPPPKPRNDI